MSLDKRKKEIKQKKVFSKPFIAFLIIGMLAVVIFQVQNHDLFKISGLTIEGNRKYKNSDILVLIDNPIDKNIFFYDTKNQEKKLMANHNIEKATVIKKYPNKIEIDVEENYPAFLLSTADKDYIVDNHFNVINKKDLEGKNVQNLIELKSFELSDDKKKLADNKSNETFLKTALQYKCSEHFKKIDFENNSNIGIMYKDIDIEFGDMQKADYKFKLLETVIKDINNKNLKVKKIMLNQGKNPVVVMDNE